MSTRRPRRARRSRATRAAQARLEHAGGYAWRDHAGAVVRGLGFAEDDLDRPLSTFSGGELTRASLARALAGGPDLLLLDEPTNHLDVASIEWLERELADIDAAVILVAHDRWFLEAVTTATLELDAGRSTFFPGPWHAWRQERAMRLAAASKAAERYEVDIERLQRFVERFRAKKNLAKRAQAKLTQIGRLEQEQAEVKSEISLLTRRSRRLGFEFLDPPRSGRTVLEAEGLVVEVPRPAAARGRDLRARARRARRARRPERLGQDDAAGDDPRPREPGGGQGRGSGTASRPAYFSQHEIELDGTLSLLETAQKHTGLPRPQAQSLLGRFLFSGWSVHEQKVGSLSGGERRRLALALVVASGANFLVLDEPTNHLDLESREALEAALEAFPGTVLLVSHDRALLDAVAQRTLAIEEGRIVSYEGGWAELLRRREEVATAERARPRPPRRRRSRAKAKPTSGRRPRAPSELERVEREIAAARGARSPSSSSSSPTTGATSRSSPRTAVRATSSRRCSRGGKSSSSGHRRDVTAADPNVELLRELVELESPSGEIEPLRTLGCAARGRAATRSARRSTSTACTSRPSSTATASRCSCSRTSTRSGRSGRSRRCRSGSRATTPTGRGPTT